MSKNVALRWGGGGGGGAGGGGGGVLDAQCMTFSF